MTTTEETMMTDSERMKTAVAAANFAVPQYAKYPCDGNYAKRWQAAYDAVMHALEDR